MIRPAKIFAIISFSTIFFPVISFAEKTEVIHRYRRFQDKLRTQEEFRTTKDQLTFDLLGSFSKEIITIFSDVETINQKSLSDEEKIEEFSHLLRKWDRQELFGYFKLATEIPLPKFTLASLKFNPTLFGNSDLGAFLDLKVKSNIQQTIKLSEIPNIPATILSFIGDQDIPADLPPGTDLVQYAIDEGLVDSSLASPYLDLYFMPDIALPNLSIYAKNDAQLGLKFSFDDIEPFGGHLALYSLWRTDALTLYNERNLLNNNDLDKNPDSNTQSSLQMDFRLHRETSARSTFFQLQNFVLIKMTDNISSGGELLDRYAPLARLQHMEKIQTEYFQWNLFLGVHLREGYDFSQGAYLGVESRVTAWQDRMGLFFMALIDKEYLTVGPKIKIWFLEGEYTLKNPLSSTTDSGMKASEIHSLFLRLVI